MEAVSAERGRETGERAPRGPGLLAGGGAVQCPAGAALVVVLAEGVELAQQVIQVAAGGAGAPVIGQGRCGQAVGVGLQERAGNDGAGDRGMRAAGQQVAEDEPASAPRGSGGRRLSR
jgi:hypothetical protein